MNTTPAAILFLTVAALIFATGPVTLLCAKVRWHIEARHEKRRRQEQQREVTPEWLAVIAAVEPTPIYDELVCAQIERAEGWS